MKRHFLLIVIWLPTISGNLNYEPPAGYTVKETPRSTLDLIGGVRYLGLDVRTDWNLALDITGPGGGVVLPAEGSREKDVELWDGIIGMRGHFMIGNGRWSVPYYLDLSTGSSDLT